MVLALPRLNGNESYPKCLDDVFRVNDIELCGVNTNQHSNTIECIGIFGRNALKWKSFFISSLHPVRCEENE